MALHVLLAESEGGLVTETVGRIRRLTEEALSLVQGVGPMGSEDAGVTFVLLSEIYQEANGLELDLIRAETRAREKSMAAIPVGTHGTYHSQHGDVPCTVVEYVEGRDQGDYRVAGFWNTAAVEAGEGDTFNVRSVFGSEQGAFSAHGPRALTKGATWRCSAS